MFYYQVSFLRNQSLILLCVRTGQPAPACTGTKLDVMVLRRKMDILAQTFSCCHLLRSPRQGCQHNKQHDSLTLKKPVQITGGQQQVEKSGKGGSWKPCPADILSLSVLLWEKTTSSLEFLAEKPLLLELKLFQRDCSISWGKALHFRGVLCVKEQREDLAVATEGTIIVWYFHVDTYLACLFFKNQSHQQRLLHFLQRNITL